jgi:hypothetical protein
MTAITDFICADAPGSRTRMPRAAEELKALEVTSRLPNDPTTTEGTK